MFDQPAGNRREELFLHSEQRRYRRLEVSLPVWLATADELDSKGAPWSLGYTRDLSLGGAKVVVPRGEAEHWREVAANGEECVLRFDEREASGGEFIAGRVRRAVQDDEEGIFWLGVEYSAGAEDAKAAAVRAGFATVRARRHWQWALLAAVLAIVAASFFIRDLRAQANQMQQRLTRLEAQRSELQTQLRQLASAPLAGSRAQGMDTAFQSKQLQARVRELTQNIQRLSQPENQEAGEREREAIRQREGIELSDAPAQGVQVNFGLALPYGYAWPQVVSDVEQLMDRKIPTVVIFRDFKAEFPLTDCREARARAKTMQITWEPWHFENPDAIKLTDIIAGKHDPYIDSWANAAKSFGSEVWIRWGHEFNGNWYPWSVSANGHNPQLYVKAFRHIHDRFTRAGAFNVRWVWCVNAENVPQSDWNDPRRAYPGDAYVDMIAMDGYNFGSTLPHSRWQSFAEIYDAPYELLTKAYPGKPLMIGEVASATTGGDKAAWIREMDKALRSRFHRVQGVVWFEAQKEADWRMTSSPAVLTASRSVWDQNYYRRGEP
jgi:beta-mannanase